MAIKLRKGYFNFKLIGGLPDREYPVEIDREFYESLVKTGVNPNKYNKFDIDTIVSDYTIRIKDGQAIIEGNLFSAEAEDPADRIDVVIDPELVGGTDRIDLICISIDDRDVDPNDVRDIFVEVVKGTPAASPVAPTLIQDLKGSQRYQLPIYQVFVTGGQGNILIGDITDQRVDALLGYVPDLNIVDPGGTFIMPTSGYSDVGTMRQSSPITVTGLSIIDGDYYSVDIATADSEDKAKVTGLSNAGIAKVFRHSDTEIKINLQDETKIVASTNMVITRIKNKG